MTEARELSTHRDRPLILATAGVVGARTALILGKEGFTEEGIRRVLRGSARLGFALFLPAFVSSSLVTLVPGGFSRWLVSRRRALGLSCAVAQLTAGAAIVAFHSRYPKHFMEVTYPLQRIGGLSGFVALGLLGATSFEPAKRWLGPERWRRLHGVAMRTLALNYLVSYGRRAVVNRDPVYMPFLGLLLLAMGLRVGAGVKTAQRRSSASTAREMSLCPATPFHAPAT
jgi:DMSO/TMAO reductase YedYZ heme-binding membrane subunit